MRNISFIIAVAFLFSCENNESSGVELKKSDTTSVDRLVITLEEAERLSALPLECVDVEFPNKLGQVINSYNDLAAPSELHPAFYGCFDWHSAVHGHWSLINIVRQFPDINNADEIVDGLKIHLTKENIDAEVKYFEGESNGSFERMYGWAWLLKLSSELEAWNHPEAEEMKNNIRPLAELIADKVKEFLPKLNYPIRVGTHTNTAFAMTMIYDYATVLKDDELKQIVSSRAKDYFLDDCDCPMTWEPSGYDFLSPCLEEADIMRRVLNGQEFENWLGRFLPELSNEDYTLEPGLVSDRTDGHLVHLDGLNFSRAWCLYGVAESSPKYKHLVAVANKHIEHSLPTMVDGNYEGGHWLASFALLALQED